MGIKNVVVVDTVGDIGDISRKFLNAFPFVKSWNGYEVGNDLVGKSPHPHGGMCMSQVLMPLWNDPSEVHAHFIRVFDSSGNVIEDAFGQWVIDTIKDISTTGPTYTNCSWGNYIANGDPARYTSFAAPWRSLIEETGITVMWAAGNSGDYKPDVDEEVPQGLLTDISSKIAAADSDSRPSSYSGDSINAPPTATFWSTKIHLLNPVTFNWDVASGTSFASPKACGLCAKRQLTHSAFVQLAKEKAKHSELYQGVLPHPKWGWGWLEDEFQAEIAGCPYLYSSSPRMLAGGLEWFDFELKYGGGL